MKEEVDLGKKDADYILLRAAVIDAKEILDETSSGHFSREHAIAVLAAALYQARYGRKYAPPAELDA